ALRAAGAWWWAQRETRPTRSCSSACQNRSVKIARGIIGFVLVVALAVVLYLVAGDELLGTSDADTRDPAPPVPAPANPAPADPASAAQTPAVPSDAGEAWIDYVHDGDTLFLTDGRKVRLLGIDTPEVGK